MTKRRVSRVPEDLGVAEVLAAEVEHGVARVLREGAAAVAAGRQVLGLPVLGVAGVDGDQARPVPRRARCGPPGPRPRCPRRSSRRPPRAAPPAGAASAAGRGSPRGPSSCVPSGPRGVVLVEEVVLPLEEHEPVGVVHEVPRGAEVELRPQRLVLVGEPPRRQQHSRPRAQDEQASTGLTRSPACAGSAPATRPSSRAGTASTSTNCRSIIDREKREGEGPRDLGDHRERPAHGRRPEPVGEAAQGLAAGAHAVREDLARGRPRSPSPGRRRRTRCSR